MRLGSSEQVRPLLSSGLSTAQRRRVAREELEARLEAERIVQDAKARADELLAQARIEAAGFAQKAADRAREDAEREAVARWLALRHAEGERLDRDAERIAAVAVVLAERLIGATLELDPGRIAALARGVLAEARGARRAVVHAHPLDAAVLRDEASRAGFDVRDLGVRDDASLARGELILHTDVGILNAKLAPRLERLAEALRDALR
jgi:flagellar assembly protein FliH